MVISSDGNGIVQKAVNRTNRNLMLACLLSFVVVIGALVVGSSYWISLVTGAKVISHDQLLATQSPGILPTLVTVQSQETYDTGYYYYTLENGRENIDVYYLVMLVGEDRWLLVESQSSTENLEYTGALISIPSDIRKDIVQAIMDEVPDIEGLILPVMLTTQDHSTLGWVALAILGVILVAGIYGMVRLLTRAGDINKHPIYKALSRYGNADKIVNHIEQEMVMGVDKIGKLQLTRKWAIASTSTTFDAIFLQQAVWMYKTITQHRTNGIPTGKTFKVLIYDKHGHLMEVSTSKNEVDSMLEAIYSRAPWIIAGYSDELKNLWGNTNGRNRMIAEVEARQPQRGIQ